MLNKRLLIKNLLAHNDENSFYDKKLLLNFSNKEGKSKFLKHVCALSNSNPSNNSYIVIGIEDTSSKIIGVDFYDDSKIQNLINAYLNNPPKIQYENVAFPKLSRYKVVGLVTINPIDKITSLNKGIWKYKKNTIFIRRGSNSVPIENFTLNNTNKTVVAAIEKNATNNIKHTLDSVFDFMNRHHKELKPRYKVFKDQFVVCWAGLRKKVGDTTFYSRVDIELINEQVRLFYSDLDDVQIQYNAQSFIITEFIQLGIQNDFTHYPLEKTIIHFKDNGKHDIVTKLLFEPPKFDPILLKHVYNSNNAILEKYKKGLKLTKNEEKDLEQLPTSYLISSLNNFIGAREKLSEIKPYLKLRENKSSYIKAKETERILRKLKYS